MYCFSVSLVKINIKNLWAWDFGDTFNVNRIIKYIIPILMIPIPNNLFLLYVLRNFGRILVDQMLF